jgi:hypothetical protein
MTELVEKIKKITSVLHWGRVYLERADSVMEETDTKTLGQFRQELSEFIRRMEKRWMGKELKQLCLDNQKQLHALRRELLRLELDVAVLIVEAERERELLKSMEDLAFPQMIEEKRTRDLANWGSWPLSYKEKFLSELAQLESPIQGVNYGRISPRS